MPVCAVNTPHESFDSRNMFSYGTMMKSQCGSLKNGLTTHCSTSPTDHCLDMSLENSTQPLTSVHYGQNQVRGDVYMQGVTLLFTVIAVDLKHDTCSVNLCFLLIIEAVYCRTSITLCDSQETDFLIVKSSELKQPRGPGSWSLVLA